MIIKLARAGDETITLDHPLGWDITSLGREPDKLDAIAHIPIQAAAE